MEKAPLVKKIDNPYWDAVKGHVARGRLFSDTPQVQRWDMSGGKFTIDGYPQREDWVHSCSWTIPDPASIEFVEGWSEAGLVDPMAGTGYWAYVLRQQGVDIVVYDAHAPHRNPWHHDKEQWVPVARLSAVSSIPKHPDRTLLLAWPPYDETAGNRALAAYKGDLVIYMGEGHGGATGDDRMHRRLDRQWAEVDEHIPVQWEGIHDRITVYRRRCGK